MTVDEFLTEFERIAPTRDWTLLRRHRADAGLQNPATGHVRLPDHGGSRAALFGTRG